jgi:hypothetical protein
LNTWGHSPYITSSLTREWVCYLQFLLAFVRKFSPRSESRDSRPYFTASDSRLPFVSPPTTRRATVEVFEPASTWDSTSVTTPNESESESYVTTDGQSARLPWNKAPIWGLRPDFYWQRVTCLLIWGALSDERTGLSFTNSTGPSQRSHSRVPVPWDSRPYFTASDSRFPFSSPRTTRRVTTRDTTPNARINSL